MTQSLELVITAFQKGLVPFLTLILLGNAAQLVVSLWQVSHTDRYPRRTVIIATMAAQAFLALLLCGLQATGLLSLWLMALLQVAISAINGFYLPNEGALVQKMVPAAHLTNAVYINAIMLPAAAGLGIALGGSLDD